MRKLELYNSTLQRIDELQKTLGMQKEKFLNEIFADAEAKVRNIKD